jgi:hypothetical protein
MLLEILEKFPGPPRTTASLKVAMNMQVLQLSSLNRIRMDTTNSSFSSLKVAHPEILNGV